MNCHTARDHLLLAQSGELSPGRRPPLDRHLAGCAACRAYRDAADGMAAQYRETPLERDVSPFILHRIDEEARRRAPAPAAPAARERPIQPGILELWRPAALSGLAALTLLLLGGLLLRHLSAPSAPEVAQRGEPLPSPAEPPAPAVWTTDVDAELHQLWTLLADAGAELESANGPDESLESLAGDLLELEGWSI